MAKRLTSESYRPREELKKEDLEVVNDPSTAREISDHSDDDVVDTEDFDVYMMLLCS